MDGETNKNQLRMKTAEKRPVLAYDELPLYLSAGDETVFAVATVPTQVRDHTTVATGNV